MFASHHILPHVARRTQVGSKEAGFTLIEMLVAMAIFSLISVATLGSFQSAVQAKAATDRAAARHETLSLMRATLQADFADMIIRRNRDAFGGLEQTVFRGGFTELLEFTRLGRVNPVGAFVRSDIQRVQYVIEDGNFIRRALRHENPAPNTESRERILLRNIAAAEILFTSNDISVSQIEIPIGAESAALDYVRINLQFEDGRQLSQIFELDLL